MVRGLGHQLVCPEVPTDQIKVRFEDIDETCEGESWDTGSFLEDELDRRRPSFRGETYLQRDVCHVDEDSGEEFVFDGGLVVSQVDTRRGGGC